MGQLGIETTTKVREQGRAIPKEQRTGVSFTRHFTERLEAGRTPYDEIRWEVRTAAIGNDKGAVIFEQRDIDVPADWSQTATNIVASKYFHGKLGTSGRETSVSQLVHRVVDTVADWDWQGTISVRLRKARTSATNWPT